MTIAAPPVAEPNYPSNRPAGPSTAATVFRRIGAVLLGLVMIVLLIFGSVIRVAHDLVGTPSGSSTILLAVVQNNTTATAIATQVVKQVEDDSSPANATIIANNAAALEQTVITTIESAPISTQVRADVTQLWNLADSGDAGTVNFRPIVTTVLDAMHATNAAVSTDACTYTTNPACSATNNAGFQLTLKSHSALNLNSRTNVLAWVFTLLGIIGALLLARFMVRHRSLQLTFVGLVIGVPALMLLAIGGSLKNAASRFHNSSAVANSVIDAALNRVGKSVTNQGLLLLIVTLAVLAIWGGYRLVRRDQKPAPAPTSPTTP